ncbi:nidogen-like domain-containing protein [Nocardioides abyssi]|uniref:Nidogen-like domain-containing protein n=1 Tax=Nocardioides abyssi TaxID=3058370 RepID=A0ABT8EZ35_9ACTN|nr:nidogen-like domain-containing protein [Nocardioides abyssi]MDN4163284.1 nidogen-like domain-containing protein [Nocardioides abyssi]
MRSTPTRRPLFLLAIVLALVLSGLGFSPALADEETGPTTLVTAIARDAQTGALLDGVEVHLVQHDGDSWYPVDQRTTEDGSAVFAVPPGNYVLGFRPPGRAYVPVLGNGVDPQPERPGDPGTFTVADDTPDLEYVSMLRQRWSADGPAVHGVLAGPGGVRPDGVLVEAYEVGDSEPAASVETYASRRPNGPQHGYFELFLQPGTYDLRISDPFDERYEARTVPGVEVTTESQDLGTIDLEAAGQPPAGGISLTVVDENDVPVPGVWVDIYRRDPRTGRFGSVMGGLPEPGSSSLQFDGLRTGRTYTACARFGTTEQCLGGANRPGEAETFEVSADVSTAVGPLVVTPLSTLAGAVRAPHGTIVGKPKVTAWVWSGEFEAWTRYAHRTGRPDGSFGIEVPTGATVALQVGRNGFARTYTGGGNERPGVPTADNSLMAGPGTTQVGRIELEPLPFANSAGPVVKGAEGEHCLSQPLGRNDDRSTRRVAIPFDLTFFGSEYSKIYINNNGNVTFDGPRGAYTPEAINGGPDEQDGAIIAPFFADVDTRGLESRIVTYGTSPDGNSLCVNWADVGYFPSRTDKLNTFQLVLSKATGSGVVPGDFDITFNYNRVEWETGDASGGSDGMGGTSALAGFTAGTGEPGTFVQLDGSLENGALVEGGPKSLSTRSQNSATPGRFIFRVRNDVANADLGDLRGRVLLPDGETAAPGAVVQACTRGSVCPTTTTNDTGRFVFTGIPVGEYVLRVNPPAVEGLTLLSAISSASVQPDGNAQDVTVVLEEPVIAGPQDVVLTTAGSTPGAGAVRVGDDGVPVTDYRADLDLVVNGCPGVIDPTFTLTLNGAVQATGALVEESPGRYTAVVPATYPQHGAANLTTSVPRDCGDRTTVGFDLYIDPSGVVTDQYGRLLAGAEVTLRRSDSENGTYGILPDGSALMSSSNRTNPDTTDPVGYFRWDVVTGWYKVDASKSGCAPASTPALEVPPERLDLLIKMTCAAAPPAPTTAPTLSGPATVGATLTVNGGVWDHGIAKTGVRWYRGGALVATGNSYVVAAADAGTTLTARVVARRASYTQEYGTGNIVVFDEVTHDVTATVPGTSGGGGGGGGGGSTALVATADPTITGTAKVGQTLKASTGTWNGTDLTYSYAWSRGGTPIAVATGAEYVATAADADKAITVTVTASKTGLTDGKATSAAVTVAKGDAPTATTAPAVTGDAEPGGTLTVSSGTWSEPGVTFAYQWLVDGTPVSGATGPSYVVRTGDAGKKVSVRVTATKAGYADGSATTEAVTVDDAPPPPATKVGSDTTATLARDVVRAGKRAKLQVRVALDNGKRAVGRLVVRVDGRKVAERAMGAGADGRLVLRLPKLGVGEHTVRVRYLGNGKAKASSSEKLSLVVQVKRSSKPLPLLL